MKWFFDSCSAAIQNAVDYNKFGLYYSENQSPDSDIHMHNCCEILFCLSGGKSFLIDGKIYEVHDNDLFLINQYEAHKIIFDQDAKFARFVLEIHPELIYHCSTAETDLSRCFYLRNSETTHQFSLDARQAAKLCGHFNNIRDNSGYANDILNYSEIMNILVFVNQLFNMQASISQRKSYKNTTQLCIDYINSNYKKGDKSLTLDALSKHTFVSVNQLCRIFKKNTGTTISKYILSKRISEAKKLLARGESVSAVSDACGFGDYANFIRTFKKNVGVSPGKYVGLNNSIDT